MSTKELKKKLITRIQEEGNNDLLERAMHLFESASSESIYELNQEQIAAITEAREQVANGDYLTNEESNAEIDEWLNSL